MAKTSAREKAAAGEQSGPAGNGNKKRDRVKILKSYTESSPPGRHLFLEAFPLADGDDDSFTMLFGTSSNPENSVFHIARPSVADRMSPWYCFHRSVSICVLRKPLSPTMTIIYVSLFV